MFISEQKGLGFTLAEILITLGIIGVVAALTIPALISEYSKIRTVTQLKKVHAEISQALKLAEAENGTPEGWYDLSASVEDGTSATVMNKYLEPHIKMVQKCISDFSPCWIDKYKTLAGTVINSGDDTIGKFKYFVTLSGYSVKFWAGGLDTSLYEPHYQFIVDINGKSLPNILGKDIFQFTYVQLTSGGWALIPFGFYGPNYNKKVSNGGRIIKHPSREELLTDSNYGCSKDVRGNSGSVYCAALIFKDGWKISKDYPWK